MEAFLRTLLPRLVPAGCTFNLYPFQGKSDLLGSLSSRLHGYAAWIPDDWRIVVVVDRDDENCVALKRRMEQICRRSGLRSKSSHPATWQLVNRIAIEELEAWFFGDWEAVRAAYPRASENVPRKQAYRCPDAIVGGTWEAFERVMIARGYFRGGLEKISAAREIGARIDPNRSTSPSFLAFCTAIAEAFV
jgi:hypothetical protein